MANPGTPTLDQLRVFLAVVDAGSFAGAARELGRATSVVSYSIANLETQLGVELFDRGMTKRPRLNESGRAILSETRSVALSIDRLRAQARRIQKGIETEIHLAVDVIVPASRISDALKAFQIEFPTVSLHLRVEALGAVTQLVRDRVVSLGICGPPHTTIDGIERIAGLGSVDFLPVAAPDHPLATGGINSPGAGRDHVQLVLTDRSAVTKGQEFAVFGSKTWRVADLYAKHALLRDGVGWGNMPLVTIREDLDSGRLVRLDMPDCISGNYRFEAIFRTDNPPGPAASFLISRFKSNQ